MVSATDQIYKFQDNKYHPVFLNPGQLEKLREITLLPYKEGVALTRFYKNTNDENAYKVLKNTLLKMMFFFRRDSRRF